MAIMRAPYKQSSSRPGVGTCRLCQKVRKLRYSHILPEFFYKELYHENHTLFAISTDPSHPIYREQKGLREYLLCDDCESRFGQWEDYAKRVIYDEHGRGNEGKDIPGGFMDRGIDYDKYKLFQMSLLWRMSVTSLSWFSNVTLGPHEETMREMLLRGDPGEPHEYGCALTVLKPTDGKLFEHMIQPDVSRMEGHRIYSLVAAGFLWLFVVSKHSIVFPFKDRFLQRNGTMRISVMRPQQIPDIAKQVIKLEASGKLEMLKPSKSKQSAKP